MTDLSLVLFDLNGVLYRYDRAARVAAIATVSKRSPNEVLSAIWDSGFEDSGDAGTLDAVSYLRGFGARIGYDITEAEWLHAQQVAVSPIDATLALLGRIRPTVRRAVLTNNNLLVSKYFSKLYPKVAALVADQAYVSAEFGARKPDPDVYRRCLERLDVAPEAALFVDDGAANVAGARQAGLNGHIYACPHALEQELLGRALLD